MNEKLIRIISISGAYIALLIGGAFATGQEEIGRASCRERV